MEYSVQVKRAITRQDSKRTGKWLIMNNYKNLAEEIIFKELICVEGNDDGKYEIIF